jgi:hypothetical protein
MFYDLDMAASTAQNFAVIRKGEFPLYDVRMRLHDLDRSVDVLNLKQGELNSPADYAMVKCPIPESVYCRVFFEAPRVIWGEA